MVELPRVLADRAQEPDIRDILADERELFESRSSRREGQKAQLEERINQLCEQIGGLDAQRQAKADEVQLIRKELHELEKLWAQNLVPRSKLIAMQRDAARTSGEHAQMIASVAQARAKIAETKLQIIQLDQDLKTEVMKELRENQAKESELSERRIAAEDQLQRIDIRSPQTGIVHQLAVHTVGGVVKQSEPIMLIVPEGDGLVIEARIAPRDIDHVRTGQAAFIRLPAFNQRTTPEFNGVVDRVAADLTKDPQTNQSYYMARIALPEADLKRVNSLKLLPGMPAEVHVRTGERTLLSYLTKPLTDQISRAFAEQ